MVHFSEAAKAYIINFTPKGYFLRVGIKGGACSSQFLLGFDKMTEYDTIHEVGKIKILIDNRHLMYVMGVEIDYIETENGAGFSIKR